MIPKTTKDVRIRLTLENPAAKFAERITLWNVIMGRIDCGYDKWRFLAPYDDQYNFYEIHNTSLVVSTSTRYYIPLYWVNVLVDGNWYGSRPLIRGSVDMCARCYDPDYQNVSDISIVKNGKIQVSDYPVETRLHLINSKIIL